MSNSIENAIREKRTIEAEKKRLMGPSGKFGVILQVFGSKITRQGSGLVDADFLDDPYEDGVETEYGTTMSGQVGPMVSRDELPYIQDELVFDEGLLFDGLSRGMHLEIVFWFATNEIIVSYKGYQVYKEIAGELQCYAPFSQWENMIERLYTVANAKFKNSREIEQIEMGREIERKKVNFWEKLRMRWGV